MITSMKWVQEYFLCHLHRRRWNNFSREYRMAAVTMAEQDIILELGLATLDPNDLLLLCAIAEQAYYLADNHDRAQSKLARKTGELKSENIEGLGSRSYYQSRDGESDTDSGVLPRIAPRTECFLAKYPGYRTNRLSRG